jgi:hypothetical protein
MTSVPLGSLNEASETEGALPHDGSGVTVVVSVDESFEASGSLGEVAFTLAVLLSVPSELVRTWIDPDCVSPLPMSSRLQVHVSPETSNGSEQPLPGSGASGP